MRAAARGTRDPFAGKSAASARAVPHAFVLDALESLDPRTKPMFGCLAVYVGERIVFILRDRGGGDPDDGVWVAFESANEAAVRALFPALVRIEVFESRVSGWLKLSAKHRDFEDDVLTACELVRAHDPRLGKVPNAKKAPAKKAPAKKAPAKKSAPKRAPPKKSAAAKAPAKKPASKKTRGLAETAPTKTGVRRRDGGGRVDPAYQADLLEKSGHDHKDRDATAFLDAPESEDAAVENLGEGFVHNVTGGEETDEERPDPNAPDEEGGPYVVTTAAEEFGREPDESNPEDAEPAPFPITQSES